jgi:hypothetical protein
MIRAKVDGVRVGIGLSDSLIGSGTGATAAAADLALAGPEAVV